MPLESTTVASETARFTPRNYLFPLTSAFILAYAEIINGVAHAQSAHPTAQQAAEHEENEKAVWPLDRLKEVLGNETPKLDAEFKIREEAELKIRTALRNALYQRNPLPQEIHDLMKVPRISNGTMETFARMRGIKESVITDQLEMPGRIASPDEKTTLTSILERQFDCTITTDDASLKERLAQHRYGMEGDTSGAAFERLCQHSLCIPIRTRKGFFLKPMLPGAELRMNGFMGLVTQGQDEKRRTEVFMLPDKGIILTTEIEAEKNNANEGPDFNPGPVIPQAVGVAQPAHITMGAFSPWTKEDCQHTPTPKTEFDANNPRLTAIIATKPETMEIEAIEEKKITIGEQVLWIKKTTNQPDGTWVTEVDGEIWKNVEWPVTTNIQDMYSYQLVAANQITGLSAKGEALEATVTGLHFDKRIFRLNIQTPQKPDRFRIKAFTDINLRTLALP